jgi:hypothetical protein
LSTITLTAKDVARLAGCHPGAVDRAIAAGDLPDRATEVPREPRKRYQRAVPLEAARAWASVYRERAQQRAVLLEQARQAKALRREVQAACRAVTLPGTAAPVSTAPFEPTLLQEAVRLLQQVAEAQRQTNAHLSALVDAWRE